MIWLLLLPTSLLMTVLGYVLAPILPLFASVDGWLPRWLWWFQTPDNSLDGDADWRARNLPRYVGRVGWLLRNPAYGYDWGVLAAHIAPDAPFACYGNPEVQDHPLFAPGWVIFRHGDYWRFYLVWPSFPGRYLRVNLGWKITPDRQNDPCQFVFSGNPFMARPAK